MMNRRRALADPQRQAGTRQRLLVEPGRRHLRCSGTLVPKRTTPSLVGQQLPRRPMNVFLTHVYKHICFCPSVMLSLLLWAAGWF